MNDYGETPYRNEDDCRCCGQPNHAGWCDTTNNDNDNEATTWAVSYVPAWSVSYFQRIRHNGVTLIVEELDLASVDTDGTKYASFRDERHEIVVAEHETVAVLTEVATTPTGSVRITETGTALFAEVLDYGLYSCSLADYQRTTEPDAYRSMLRIRTEDGASDEDLATFRNLYCHTETGPTAIRIMAADCQQFPTALGAQSLYERLNTPRR